MSVRIVDIDDRLAEGEAQIAALEAIPDAWIRGFILAGHTLPEAIAYWIAQAPLSVAPQLCRAARA